ncbi:hypothetical protein DFJ73DRAFT_622333, partial [Zopfochytrium polystomum]
LVDLGVHDVPSLHKIKQIQKLAVGICQVTTRKFKTSTGKLIYYNSIADTIRLELAKPEIWNYLHFYPTLDNCVRELSGCSKWLYSISSPMVPGSGEREDIFAEEVYSLQNGSTHAGTFYITTFAYDCLNREMVWFGYQCDLSDNVLLIDQTAAVQFPVDDSSFTLTPLLSENYKTFWKVDTAGTIKPSSPIQSNPLRQKAAGKSVLMAPLTLSEDDLSGNVSKKWNKYESWSFTFAGLPEPFRSLREHNHFILASKTATGIESTEVIAKNIRELHEGIDVPDPIHKKDVVLIGCILQLVGDNPMHTVMCSRTGLASLHPCRFCLIPDWQLETTPEQAPNRLASYLDPHSSPNFQLGLSAQEVKNLLSDLHKRVMLGAMTRQKAVSIAAANGVKDWYFEKGMEEKSNLPQMNPLLGHPSEDPFFNLGFDAPIDILHCTSLGIVKYAMRATLHKMKKPQRALLQATLNGIDHSGFPKPFNGYELVHYTNSLNGKDLHAFSQIATFALKDLVSDDVLKMWINISAFDALLHAEEIRDMDDHCEELAMRHSNLANTILKCEYRWDLIKPKLHILSHAPFYTQRFGPLRRSAAHGKEAQNKLVRYNILATNRRNTSRDVAINFSVEAAGHHLMSGGYCQLQSGWIPTPSDFSVPQVNEGLLLEIACKSICLLKPQKNC